jgi:hypothetical protein
MNIYVAEINGRGIAARNAEDQFAAENYFDSKPFRNSLMTFKNEGQSLWNGNAKILVRNPRPEEVAAFDAAQATAIEIGQLKHKDDPWFYFLVPVTC